jgi:hypothetical protein
MAIQMFFNDYNPPHFRGRYGSTRALIRIADGRIISGELPPMARRIVEEWARARRGELEENWRRARARMPLEKVAGPDGE